MSYKRICGKEKNRESETMLSVLKKTERIASQDQNAWRGYSNSAQ